MSGQFLGHPRGLLICCATEFWERFSFYGMRALLVFYLMQHFLFSDAESFLIYGAYTAMVYMTPVVGGLIADRYLGARKAVALGAVLLVVGHLGMVFEGVPATQQIVAGNSVVTRDAMALQGFYFSLALIATGVGFLKCNTTALVGALYPLNDARRDSAFTVYYMIYNIGAAVAPLLCGWIGQTYGWRYGFGLAGLGMLAGLLVFVRGQRLLLGHAEPPDAKWLESRVAGVCREHLIYAGAVVLVVIVWLILRHQQALGPMLSLGGLGVGSVILYYAFTRCTPVERDRLLACATLIVFTIGFWAIYEQLGSSLNVFVDRFVDRSLFGWEIKASMLQSLNPVFVVVGAPLASSLWLALGKRGRDPSPATKFSLAIAQLGLGFLMFSLGAAFTPPGGSLNLGWLVLGVLLMTTGEMCLAPIGMSMVTRLSPKRIVGAMTGAFFLAYSASGFISGLIAQATSATTLEGELLDRTAALRGYASVYTNLGLIAIGVALLLIVLAPWLVRRMHVERR